MMYIQFAADDNFKFWCFFQNNQKGMIFHENRLPADDSPYFSKIRKDVAKFVICCSGDWRFKG